MIERHTMRIWDNRRDMTRQTQTGKKSKALFSHFKKPSFGRERSLIVKIASQLLSFVGDIAVLCGWLMKRQDDRWGNNNLLLNILHHCIQILREVRDQVCFCRWISNYFAFRLRHALFSTLNSSAFRIHFFYYCPKTFDFRSRVAFTSFNFRHPPQNLHVELLYKISTHFFVPFHFDIHHCTSCRTSTSTTQTRHFLSRLDRGASRPLRNIRRRTSTLPYRPKNTRIRLSPHWTSPFTEYLPASSAAFSFSAYYKISSRRSVAEPNMAPLCRFFAAGNSMRGQNCNFSHEEIPTYLSFTSNHPQLNPAAAPFTPDSSNSMYNLPQINEDRSLEKSIQMLTISEESAQQSESAIQIQRIESLVCTFQSYACFGSHFQAISLTESLSAWLDHFLDFAKVRVSKH